MAWAPSFKLLFKVILRLRDTDAAEGLFLEGSIEFEDGNTDTARLMFYYGTRLDPRMAGNFHNYAIALEKLGRGEREMIAAWEDYLRVAEHDARQPEETREKIRKHVAELKGRMASG